MTFLSRLFGKSESSTEVLCPHCEHSMESGHDVDACARKRMSRRYFFGVLSGAAAVAAAGPALKPTLAALREFVITDVVESVDFLLTPEIFAREALYVLKANLAIARSIDADYSKEFASSGRKIGDTIKVRLPTNFRVGDRVQFAGVR